MEENRTPPCQHAVPECNGCPNMHWEYAEQVRQKREQLQQLFQPLWNERFELVPSPSEFHYRGKVELSYVDGKLGYRLKSNPRKSFALNECLLITPKANALIRIAQQWAKQHRIPSYDVIRHEGFLGYLVIRESKSTNEIMVNVISHAKERENEVEIVAQELLKGGAASVNWMVNEGWSDNALGFVKKSWGKPFIEEHLLGCAFRISPNAFFQTNPPMAEKLFQEVLDEVGKEDRVLDLFCGMGALSIPLAKQCKSVLGIELSSESIQSAMKNKELNQTKNVRFIAGKVQSQLKLLKPEFDVVTIDPPRSGLTIKAVKRVMDLQPKKIAYVSCNPVSLKNDLELFSKAYELKQLKAFDLFPQTHHVEMLAVMQRKEI